MRELGRSGGLAGSIDADHGNHRQSLSLFFQSRFFGGKSRFDFAPGNGQHVGSGTALGLVGYFYRSHDLGRHGHAEIGGDQGRLQLLDGGRREFRRPGDDPFDFVDEFVLGFLQTHLELLKESHELR